MSERIEALNLEVKDWHRWDETKRHDYIENILKGLTGAKRDELIQELPDALDQVKEELKQELEELRGIRHGDRSESDAEQIEIDRQLLRDLGDILQVVKLVDQEQDILNTDVTDGNGTFSGYKLEGQTYNINFTDAASTSPFGTGPATSQDTVPSIDSDPFATPGQVTPADGTPEDGQAPADAASTTPVNRDSNTDGIADQDFNQDGVINYNDLIPPKSTDMLNKPHVMLAIHEGDLVDVVGWNPDTKVLQLKVYNAEGKFSYLNINGIDPANFALLFDGGVSEQNLDSYRNNVPTELLGDFYWKDSTDSFADKLGLAPQTLPADRLAAIPKYKEVQDSLNNLDFVPYSGDAPMDEVRTAVDKIFTLFDTNQVTSDQVKATWHQIVEDTTPLGPEAQAKVFTALTVLLRMHLDDATLGTILGPSVLEIEAILNPSKNPADMNKNQMLATIALETTAPGNYGGPETLLNKLFSAGMGTVGDFSGQAGIDALQLIQQFSAQTGLYLPGVDNALKNEQELETSGGVIEITDELTAGLAALAHPASQIFAAVENSGTDAQAVDAGLMTLINTIKAMGPKAAVADLRSKIIDTTLTFPPEAQDDIMAAFLTMVHEGFPDLFSRLTQDTQFIANSWSIVDNGAGKPQNYEKIMGWLQTAAIQQVEEIQTSISPDHESRSKRWAGMGFDGGMKGTKLVVNDTTLAAGATALLLYGLFAPGDPYTKAAAIIVGAGLGVLLLVNGFGHIFGVDNLVGTGLGYVVGGVGGAIMGAAGGVVDGVEDAWHAVTPW